MALASPVGQSNAKPNTLAAQVQKVRVGTLFVPLCLYAFMPLCLYALGYLGTWVHGYKQRGPKSIAHQTYNILIL